MRRLTVSVLLALGALTIGSGVLAADPPIPKITVGDRGWVDTTGTVSAGTMEALRDQSDRIGELGFQLAGVFFNNIDGSLSQFATKVGNDAGIGDAEKDNGLLIVVLLDRASSKDGKTPSVFVATGRGMEGLLTDAKVGRFLDNYFFPIKGEGRWEEGLITLSTEFANFLASPEAKEFRTREEASPQSTDSVWFWLTAGALILIFGGFAVFFLFRPRRQINTFGRTVYPSSSIPPVPRDDYRSSIDPLIMGAALGAAAGSSHRRDHDTPRRESTYTPPPTSSDDSSSRRSSSRHNDDSSSSFGGSSFGGGFDSGSSSSFGGGGDFGGGGSGDN